MYQTPFSDFIRNTLKVPTIAVGNIYEPDHVNSIITCKARSVAVARAASGESELDFAAGQHTKCCGDSSCRR